MNELDNNSTELDSKIVELSCDTCKYEHNSAFSFPCVDCDCYSYYKEVNENE